MITSHTPSAIYITPEDYARLKLLAAALPKTADKAGRPSLRGELDRATIISREALPSGVVTVNSRVRLEDLSSGEIEEYILTWPERADAAENRLSVIAPIGTAVLGYRKGDEIGWPTPGGTRHLRIVEVEPLQEDALKGEGEVALSRLLYGAMLQNA